MARSIISIRMDNLNKQGKPMSQIEFAKKIGVPISTYQRYERNETQIPVDVVVNIADTVGIVDIREINYQVK